MNQDWHLANSSWTVPLAEMRDNRIVRTTPVEPGKLTSLLVWTQQKLWAVARSGVDVGRLVQITDRSKREGALICGKRKGSSFIRRDGVRCHFKIVVREVEGGLEPISYALQLDAPDDHRISPRFLRWEYSGKRQPNVDAVKEPLAHVHPGHDDVRLPSPVLGPKELITVFLGLELWT